LLRLEFPVMMITKPLPTMFVTEMAAVAVGIRAQRSYALLHHNAIVQVSVLLGYVQILPSMLEFHATMEIPALLTIRVMEVDTA